MVSVIGIIGFGGFGIVSEYPRGAAVFMFSMLSGTICFDLTDYRIKSNWRYRNESGTFHWSVRR